jgi:hypothetical protein
MTTFPPSFVLMPMMIPQRQAEIARLLREINRILGRS